MTTTPDCRDTDTPGLTRPARLLTAAAAALTLIAGTAEARDVSPAPKPIVIERSMETDCLFWDLCAAGDRSWRVAELAMTVIEDMEDPDALYVLRLPQLPARWERPEEGALKDSRGELIDRGRLALYRSDYESRVERALIDVAKLVRAARPGAALSIEGYRSFSIRDRREAYSGLEGHLSFLSFPESTSAGDARSLDRWLDGQGVGDGETALVETGDGWVLVGGGDLIDRLEAPLESRYVDAWPGEEGSSTESLAGPTELELEESVGEGEDMTVTDLGLTMLPHLRAARDGLPDPRPNRNPEGEGTGGGGDDGGPGDGPGEGGPGGGDEGGEETPVSETLLIPGEGFVSATPQPAPRGIPSQPGYDARAIARWDVVPYQAFDDEFKIGVVAFHRDGIHRVDFSVEGGEVVSVYQPTLNDRTGVVEYWATLDASRMDDGVFEVRAIVYPNTGEPRVLAGDMSWENEYQDSQWTGEHSMFLYANAGGTVEQEIVEVPSGTYEWGSIPGQPVNAPNDRWTVIKAAPGADVTVLPGRWNGEPMFTKLEGVRLLQPDAAGILGGAAQKVIWFDGVEYEGPGMYELTNGLRVKHTFATNSSFRESRFGHVQNFVRDCVFESIGEDTMKKVYFVANTKVRNLRPKPEEIDWHPGVIANPIVHDNRIYYGLDINTWQKCWALYNGSHEHFEHRDVAIVNCRTEKEETGNHMFYLGGTTKHMLIEDNDWFGDDGWLYRLQDDLPNPAWRFNPSDVVLRNNNWWNDPDWTPTPADLDGVEIEMIGR